MPRPSLTPTQAFILAHARDRGGVFLMYRGDRNGTRLGGPDELDRPGFVAYGEPEAFLRARGMIEAHGNESNYWRLTDKGREAIGDRAPPAIKPTRCGRGGFRQRAENR